MIDPDMGMLFLDFVAERHKIWERRQKGETGPWTRDPILASRKFTNVFRVLDPGSQFVFELVEDDPSDRDLLMRLFLYRHTGRIETWKWLRTELGWWPTVDELDTVLEIWKDYRVETKLPLFTSAYLVYPQSATPGTDKIESILGLTKRLFTGTMPELFLMPGTQRDRFTVLRSNKGVADFMSMQILTDWGYLRGGDEDEFVVCGPGAKKGAAYLDSSTTADVVLMWAVGAVRDLIDCPVIEPHDNELRWPSYMDTQNCLCEFSKYVRFLEKPVTQAYHPAHPGPQQPPVLPKHW